MEFPDRSKATPSSPTEGHRKPVVQGVVKAPRKPSRRIYDYIFAESPKELMRRITRDVIEPRVKAGFEEAAQNFLSGMLWGSGGNRPPSMISSQIMRAGAASYHNIPPSTSLMAATAVQNRTPTAYEDLVCPTQESAETLLANLYAIFNQYRIVTVADLYEVAGITAETQHEKMGWYSLESAKIYKERTGYRLALPRPSMV